MAVICLLNPKSQKKGQKPSKPVGNYFQQHSGRKQEDFRQSLCVMGIEVPYESPTGVMLGG